MDGSAYTLRMLPGTNEAADWFIKFQGLRYWDLDDGGVPPLLEMMGDYGMREACDAIRGFFPHVVTQIELSFRDCNGTWIE